MLVGGNWNQESQAGVLRINNHENLIPGVKPIIMIQSGNIVYTKIIFLDIDGVLNGSNFFIHYFYKIMYKLKLGELAHKVVDIFGVHETKVKRLSKIVKATGAKIVMSSSWRHGWKRYQSNPDDPKAPDDLRKLDRLFKKYGIEVIDITGYDSEGRRGVEILQWLARHESEVYSFCIIDDEKFDIESLFSDRLVYTNGKNYRTGYWGLRHKHISQAIEIMSKPIRELPTLKGSD